MTCRGCGDKPSRYSGDVDNSNAPGFSNSDAPARTSRDPFAAFIAAKNMTYEQMVEKRIFQKRLLNQQEDQLLAEMSDPMRRMHVDTLVAAANCEETGVPGMSPGHAVVALRKLLDNPAFSFISDIYPTLRAAVESRYAELQSGFLP